MARNNNKYRQPIIYHSDAPVFKFINPNRNDKLSQMSGFDLQDLIVLIDEYYLELRSRLGFNDKVTFGLELEFEHAMEERLTSEINKVFHGSWRIVPDGSLKQGAEINSPILKDVKESWQNLDTVCTIANSYARIDANCGGHVHVGTQTLGSDKNSWLNFIKIWSVYENIIFRFAYGLFFTGRSNIGRYAEPMANNLSFDYEKLKSEKASLEAIIKRIAHKRNQAVNFDNVIRNKCACFSPENTIEFRCPNGSLDAVVWQNNVNFFVKLLCYSKSSNFDKDIIEKREESNIHIYDDLELYDEVYLEQALELCDLIFNNNFDKVYFLRQYLKSFQTCKRGQNYLKTYRLSKKRK